MFAYFRKTIHTIQFLLDSKFIEFQLILICLFGCLGGFRPTREFFTHWETSPLPVGGYKFRPIFGFHGHGAVGVSLTVTPTVTRETPTYY